MVPVPNADEDLRLSLAITKSNTLLPKEVKTGPHKHNEHIKHSLKLHLTL